MVVGEIPIDVDVVVLGAGPGGYTVALRAAQLGQQVVLVDPGGPGGRGLHDHCLPAQALLAAADRLWRLRDLAEMGIDVQVAGVDRATMQAWSSKQVAARADAIAGLLEHSGVEFVRGRGRFSGEREVRVESEHGALRYTFRHCVIATGAEAVPWPGLPFDGQRVLTPAQGLRLETLPEQITVVGADVYAVELATLWAKLGASVRLARPSGDNWLDDWEPQAVARVTAGLKRLGVSLESEVRDWAAQAGAGPFVICAGLSPCTDGLDLDAAGVATDRAGFIAVDGQMRTGNPAVFAVGDVTGGLSLAALATAQGQVAAEAIAGRPALYAPQAIPRVVRADPEVARVGLTAAEARALGYEVVRGQWPHGADDGRTTERLALVVADASNEVLLGMTIVGAGAGHAIGEAALALEMGGTLTDLAATIHPWWGWGTTLQEAAEAALLSVS